MRRLQDKYPDILANLALFCFKKPFLTLALGALAAAGSLFYGWHHLPVNGRQGDLVSQDAPFQKLVADIDSAFPEQAHTILIVVTAPSALKAERAAETIFEAARERGDLFHGLFYPQAEPFFQKNGLLYLTAEEVERFASRLAEAQPALAELSRGANLVNLFDLIRKALEAEKAGRAELPPTFSLVMARLAQILNPAPASRRPHDPASPSPSPELWGDAFPEWSVGEAAGEDPIRVILAQPRMDYSKILAAQEPIRFLRHLARATESAPDGIRVGLTGREVLDHEQMESIGRSVEIASLLSSAALFLLLTIGTGSLLATLCILISLALGLCWCVGFAAIAVQEINMISAAFVILYMGIGVAFAIHITLRFMEERRRLPEEETAEACRRAARGAGSAVALCAITSAVGFLSFIPTPFAGLADLGVIAGGGLCLALLSALTMLPALFSLLPPPAFSPRGASRAVSWGRFFYEKIRRHCRTLSAGAVLLALAALPAALNVEFDHSALSVKDPRSESVIFLKELRRRGLYNDYTISVLAQDKAAADAKAPLLEALPTVRKVETHRVYVPEDQPLKAAILEDAATFLPPPEERREEKPGAEGFLSSARALYQTLEEAKPEGEARRALGQSLARFLARENAGAALRDLSARLMRDVPRQMKRLRLSLSAQPFVFDDLPPTIKRQVQAADGRIRMVLYPKGDLSDMRFAPRFIEEARALEPSAIGLPVAEYAVGEITVDAFRLASLIAFCVIGALLFVLLRGMRNVVLALLPILIAASFTLASCVALGISLNFGNILVLPLMLGLGVDNGIHMLTRAKSEENLRAVMGSTTPLAISLANLSTLASFGSMMLSPHEGLASMGYTLTIAMGFTLISALVVLPAILAWVRKRETVALARAPASSAS